MTQRNVAWLALMAVGGVLGAGVSLYAVYAAYATDFRPNPVLTTIYCILPAVCFPTFVLIRRVRRAAVLLAIGALCFLSAYSALNWRTCAELGYCGSIVSTVLDTLKTRVVLAFFAVAVISFIATAINEPAAHLKPKSRVR